TTVEAYDPATDTWSAKASMQTERYSPAVGVVNGRIYACGGYHAGVADYDSVEEYDPQLNTWTLRQPMPVALHGIGGTAVSDGKIYVISGVASSVARESVTTVQCFDPRTNSWSIKAPIPTARSGAAAGTLNGEIYMVGGYAVSGSTQLSL